MDERARRVFRTFMVGSAVAASLAALEAGGHLALAATNLTALPSSAEAGTSPAMTLNWTLSGTGPTLIRVNVGTFTFDSTGCASSQIELSIGGVTTTPSCLWDPIGGFFELGPVTPTAANAIIRLPAGTLTAGSPGTSEIAVYDSGRTANAYVSITAAPRPPDWFQSYQRGAIAEDCATTWNPSWAMWANNGTGGFVCVRTQYYDPGLAAWSYR